MHDAEPRVCRTRGDVEAASGKRARVAGEYVELDLRRAPEPPPRYLGRAGLRLDDGALVLLEPSWSPSGIRGADERRRLAGKKVEAIGTVWAKAPKPPKPVAHRTGPCLAPVESVREAR